MKIAVIAPSGLPSRRANAIQTLQMANAFARLGHEVLLLAYPTHPRRPALAQGEKGERWFTPSLSQTHLERSFKQVDWQDLAAEYGLASPFEVDWIEARSWARRYDYALQAILKAQRWGAHCLFTRLPQAAALASLWGKATIFEAHDLPRGGAAQLFRLFLLGRGAKRVVAITQALANDLTETYPLLAKQGAKFLTIAPDGVNLDQYTPVLSPAAARQKLRTDGWELPNGFIAGYTGHLYRGRGAELIISLACALPQAHFLIVGGEKEQKEELEQQFKSRQLANYTLTGLVAPAQIPLFQMACDVLLMPYQERVAASSGGDIAPYLSPLKLFEYLASARPILASDLAVLGEVLNAENAVLLPIREGKAWEGALSTLMEDSARRNQLAAAARLTAQAYTWEKRAERILGD